MTLAVGEKYLEIYNSRKFQRSNSSKIFTERNFINETLWYVIQEMVVVIVTIIVKMTNNTDKHNVEDEVNDGNIINNDNHNHNDNNYDINDIK